MKSRNNNGPRIDPCGTPQVIVCLPEIIPFTFPYCALLVRYDSNHLINTGVTTFINFNFFNSYA